MTKSIKCILVIGAGPIVIGQACEFDYSGTQSCIALRELGYKVILINSNPATIMTDKSTADVVYIEPIIPEIIEKIIIKEKPDAILPTMGGQTALNVAMELNKLGMLEKYNIKLIGADKNSILKAENRKIFNELVNNIGLKTPKNIIVNSYDEIESALNYIGIPAIIRPSFTLGGAGSGIAYTKEQFVEIASLGIDISPTNQVQIDESIIGWKEYELEVIRDKNNNCIVVCAIENIDPMGVHTGDSITVAPIITLRDKEYQEMRDASFAILREVGIESGGSNVQFAFNPKNGDIRVIEMNPRVSRSSALASKATGYPIAKIAAKLSVGYTLDKLKNDLTSVPASFEPTLDYIVVKIPKFNFEKFTNSEVVLSSSMKSVGEVMGIGRSFPEALQKALCSLESGYNGLNSITKNKTEISEKLSKLLPNKILIIADAIRNKFSLEDIAQLSKYDSWFIKQIEFLIDIEEQIKTNGLPKNFNEMVEIKKLGFSDSRLAELTNNSFDFVRKHRKNLNVIPIFKTVDTCAAEFPARTSYLYKCYENDLLPECESIISEKEKVIVIGSGPNRIGQGIEFDYACVHAIFAIKEEGYEAIMINCNPETVSTDYDTANKLYFSPVDAESVLDIVEKESSNGKLLGIILQFGGQTPLKLSKILIQHNIKILGTSCDSIDITEDRNRFNLLLKKLNLLCSENYICYSEDEVKTVANQTNFPIIMRPSYVLGGESMEIIYDSLYLMQYLEKHKTVFDNGSFLVDKFLIDAIELDVDAISDGKDVYVTAIMEHIEEAGVHSGDSSCSIPTINVSKENLQIIKDQTTKIALELTVIGLINIQFAIKDNKVFILEVNTRASRTVPFVSKATDTNIVNIATKVILGKKLKDIDFIKTANKSNHIAVKHPVFSFQRFSDSDILLGPEMKSTGEVMGIDKSFAIAFAKAFVAAGNKLPLSGSIFISVKDDDKPKILMLAKMLCDVGFIIFATRGTANFLNENNISTHVVNKVKEGSPHIVEMLKKNEINLIINTSHGVQSIADSFSIRYTAIAYRIPCCTNLFSAHAVANAILEMQNKTFDAYSIN